MAEQNNIVAGKAKSNITLVVMSEDKLAAITERAKTLVETIQRHDLELIRAGFREALAEGDGCCNCVAC
jgi:hypothetical protein